MDADVTVGTDGGGVVPLDRAGRAGSHLRLAGDDELDGSQLATMDSLWHARREGITDQDATELERLIRSGQVGAARYWLGVARRAVRDRVVRNGVDPENG